MNGVLDGLEILPESLSGNRLIADYYEGSPRLGPFYAGYPWSISAFRRRVEHLKRRSMAERQFVLREAIQPSTPRAAEKLERIAAGDGFVITTGQQAGLLGGPLYTSYKILTAVKLARELENALRVPVAPLFWVPADDHDWEEVNHLVLVDARNQLQRVELPDTAETAVYQQIVPHWEQNRHSFPDTGDVTIRSGYANERRPSFSVFCIWQTKSGHL